MVSSGSARSSLGWINGLRNKNLRKIIEENLRKSAQSAGDKETAEICGIKDLRNLRNLRDLKRNSTFNVYFCGFLALFLAKYA